MNDPAQPAPPPAPAPELAAKPNALFSRFNIICLLIFALAAVAVILRTQSQTKTTAELLAALPAPLPELAAALAQDGTTEQSVVLAGGCFWGVQAVFQHTRGVVSAVSGYAGGTAADANYQSVISGLTSHAEAVQVKFDPRQVSLLQILQIYFAVAHDPTQLNRQHPDEGPQYRSAVFYETDAQRLVTQTYLAQVVAAQVFSTKIATQLLPLKGFYPAEAEHQNYATRHPDAPYIAQFDAPKIANLKAYFASLYRPEPVLVRLN